MEGSRIQLSLTIEEIRSPRIKEELKKGKLPCDIYKFHCSPQVCWFYLSNDPGIYPGKDSICNQRLAEKIDYEAGKIDKPWWYREDA